MWAADLKAKHGRMSPPDLGGEFEMAHTRRSSEHDRTVVFEHFGCEKHSHAEDYL